MSVLSEWAEKTSTDLARRFDLIRVEDLKITNMTRSAKGTRESPGRNVRAKAGLTSAAAPIGEVAGIPRLQLQAGEDVKT